MRVALLLMGLCIAHLGVTLFLQTELGSDPFNVFVQGLFRGVPWPAWAAMTHGRVHLLVSLLILLVLLGLDRSYVGVGSSAVHGVGRTHHRRFYLWLASVIHGGLPLMGRLGLLVAGCLILAFGMTIVIRSQAGTGPNDLVAVVLSDKLKKPFRSGPGGGGLRLCRDRAGPGWRAGDRNGSVCVPGGPAAQLFFPVSEKICQVALRQFAGDPSRL